MGDLLAFNRRRLRRDHMVKAAEILVGDIALKAAVLDMSAAGARVFLRSPDEVVPELVTLRLPDHAPRLARHCWQRDGQVGFAFLSDTTA
jgi:hypothetical protein